MRIQIQADSQEEFDEKREAFIKSIAGGKFDVAVKPKNSSDPREPRPARIRAQAEVLRHWDDKFGAMIEDIKREVGEIIG